MSIRNPGSPGILIVAILVFAASASAQRTTRDVVDNEGLNAAGVRAVENLPQHNITAPSRAPGLGGGSQPGAAAVRSITLPSDTPAQGPAGPGAGNPRAIVAPSPNAAAAQTLPGGVATGSIQSVPSGTTVPLGPGAAQEIPHFDLGGPSAAEVETLSAIQDAPSRPGQSRAALRSAVRAPTNSLDRAQIGDRLRSRYRIDESKMNLRDSTVGAVGRFKVDGDLTPSGRPPATDDESRRGLAAAFFASELATFGLDALDDLHEEIVSTTPIGWTTIVYHRYVGDVRLDGASITVRIDPEGRIRSAEGLLLPVTPSLVEAATRETLSAEAALDLIAQDLGVSVTDGSTRPRARRLAQVSEPFVVWVVTAAGWQYTIDAFSGEILEKISIRRH